MTNSNPLVRSMMVYAICLPLAIFLGYLLTDPFDRTTDIFVGLGALLLCMPLFLRWYHPLLVLFWNMPITFIFLPGLLPGWIPIAFISFSVAIGHYILNRQRSFLHVPSVTLSLIVLALVVAITAKFRGGIGLSALGNEAIGGKRYIWIWAGVIGYFALISQPIPVAKRKLYTTLFLLSAVTPAISDLAGVLGGAFAFVYIFFPAGASAVSDAFGQDQLERFGGVASACVAVVVTMMARFGLGGILNLRKFWRPLLFFALIALSAFGGFRSILILILMTVGLMFCFEGLLRSRLMPVAVLGIVLMGGIVVAFSDQLPLPVQRCLAFLPVKISPIARLSAESSTDWRLEIWRDLLPQIPKYFFLGKGLTFDSNDMELYTTMGQNQVGGEVGGGLALAGDYHNGPLSLIIPFGIWGVLAFVWFLVASIRALWANYKYGSPDLRLINTLLLSYFIAKLLMFLIIFGGFYADLSGFIGITGFSIALNAGVARRVPATERPRVAFNRFRPLPMGRPVPSA